MCFLELVPLTGEKNSKPRPHKTGTFTSQGVPLKIFHEHPGWSFYIGVPSMNCTLSYGTQISFYLKIKSVMSECQYNMEWFTLVVPFNMSLKRAWWLPFYLLHFWNIITVINKLTKFETNLVLGSTFLCFTYESCGISSSYLNLWIWNTE